MTTASKTREQLLHHGRLAFAAKGHDGVSLHRDVLIPAGISNGSFYHQFTDKTDLLVAILEDAGARGRFLFSETAATRTEGSAEERLRDGVRLWLDLLEVGEDIFRIQLRERTNPDKRVRTLVAEVRDRSVSFLADRLSTEAQLAGATFDAQLAARLIRALTTGVVMDYLDMPKRQRKAERDDLVNGMATFVGGGLRALARADAKAVPA